MLRVLSRLLVASLALSALTTCTDRPRGMAFNTPVNLPESDQGVLIDAPDWLVIHLTKDGEILCGGEAVSLARLSELVGQAVKDHTAEQEKVGARGFEKIPTDFHPLHAFWEVSTLPLLLCIDERAPMLHVFWLFDTLQDRKVNRIWLGVQDRTNRKVLTAPLVSSFWRQEAFRPEALAARKEELPSPFICVGIDPPGYAWFPPGAEFFSFDSPLSGSQLAKLGRRSRGLRRSLWRKAFARPLGWIGANSHTRFQEFVSTLSQFRDVGVRDVEFGWEPAHPWVAAQPRLPRGINSDYVEPWDLGGLSVMDLTPLTLPLAPASVKDRADDPHDRLFVNLDGRSRILRRGKAITLDELGTEIDQAKRIYNLKQKAMGENGMEESAGGERISKLFALVRADKEVPWLHVQWIVGVIWEHGIRKLQLAALQAADLRYEPEEAARFGVRRVQVVPTLRSPDAKLPLPLDRESPPIWAGRRKSVDASAVRVCERSCQVTPLWSCNVTP